MSMVGMNVQEVQALSQQLNASANDVQQIASTLTSKLGSTTWVGQDSTQFSNDWQSTHLPAINNVVQALQHASQVANQNATDQDAVSNR